MTKTKLQLSKTQVQGYLTQELKNNPDIYLLNLSTVDGFPISQISRKEKTSIEADKVSAISSSLCSLANSASNSLLKDAHGRVNIESESGHVVMYNILLKNQQEAIISVCSNHKVSLAESRFIAKRLKENLEAL